MSHPVINIYQIFTRLFRNGNATNKPFGTIAENGVSKMNYIDICALEGLRKLGITHLWFTGIIRHATCTSYVNEGIPDCSPTIVKGRAGSPYAITDYYDVDPDLAENIEERMTEFKALVKRTHNAGMKVIIDFVPNHVAREYMSVCKPSGVKDLGEDDDVSVQFAPNNNFYYLPGQAFELPDGISFPYTENSKLYVEYPAKATGNDVFSAKPSITDWYETVKLNYGVDYIKGKHLFFWPVPDTWIKMRDILLFWANKGVDAFRCDMAEMVPVEFWHWAIAEVKVQFPEILFIAEVYNPAEYNKYLKIGRFDYLYDKVGLYDIVRSIMEEHESATQLSNYWKSREGLHHNMLRFLENHDEQRIASQQFAKNPWPGIPGMFLSGTMHNCPLMFYFGQEIGEPANCSEGFSGMDGRTTIFDYWSVAEYQKWVNNGEFDGGKLEFWQKDLRNLYSKLLHIRQDFEALREGGFYDIMYVNYGGNLNQDKVFAYLRHFQNQVLLIVLNFDPAQHFSFKLKIPKHAFGYVGLDTDAEFSATEIIVHYNEIKFNTLHADSEGIDIEIDSNSVQIFEIKEN